MPCKIDLGALFNCAALVQAGIKDYFYLVNKEDFDDNQLLTIDGSTNELTALTLASGTQGYKFTVSKGATNIIPTSPLRPTTAQDGFDHSLDVRIFDVSQLSVENIEKLRFNKVVAFVPLASGKHLLYGRNVGMRISEFEYNPSDGDTGGTLKIILKTPDEDPPEIHAPLLASTDYDITELDTPAT